MGHAAEAMAYPMQQMHTANLETCGERCRPLAEWAQLKSIERAFGMRSVRIAEVRMRVRMGSTLASAGIGWIKSEGSGPAVFTCIYLYLVGITWIGAGTIQVRPGTRGALNYFRAVYRSYCSFPQQVRSDPQMVQISQMIRGRIAVATPHLEPCVVV